MIASPWFGVFVIAASLSGLGGVAYVAWEWYVNRVPRPTLDNFRDTCGRRCEIRREG